MTTIEYLITDGAMSMDGGSISLKLTDRVSKQITVRLNWSLSAQRSNSTALLIDGVRIEPGSGDETAWIDRIRAAGIQSDYNDSSVQSEATLGNKVVAIGDDVASYVTAISEGADSALAKLRSGLIRKIRSEQHAASR